MSPLLYLLSSLWEIVCYGEGKVIWGDIPSLDYHHSILILAQFFSWCEFGVDDFSLEMAFSSTCPSLPWAWFQHSPLLKLIDLFLSSNDVREWGALLCPAACLASRNPTGKMGKWRKDRYRHMCWKAGVAWSHAVSDGTAPTMHQLGFDMHIMKRRRH